MPRSKNDTEDVCSTTAETSVDKEASTITDVIAVRRRLKRKLDMRFVVWAFLGYFAGYLDRSNLRKNHDKGEYVDEMLIL
ncbi:mfs general substrate transporter [Lichtheimia corymbifera JMRC:FSU:9682]|uniref:Mfs general substrate transporter n=1 Tax=Lichtheimia corymbifera JMRC:FSU:9682 TaxID=1263082 RepID=A0A068RGS4_9FUNG|nr:mfs general substrate transporter [Lichtheimia corymbifera JMRC:FSU:9682]